MRIAHQPTIGRRWDWPLLPWWVAANSLGAVVLTWTAHDVFMALCVPGLVVGLSQWAILHWRLRLPMGFMILWLIGSVIGGWAWLGLLDFTNDVYALSNVFPSAAIVGGVVGACAGIVQLLVFYQTIRRPGLWVIISAISSAIGWPIGQYAGNVVVGTYYGGVAGYIMCGLLSGLALVWFTRTRNQIAHTGDT